MAKIDYSHALTPPLAKARYSRAKAIPGLTASGKPKFRRIPGQGPRFGIVRPLVAPSAKVYMGFPNCSGDPIERSCNVEIKIGGTVVFAKVFREGKKVFYGPAKMQKNVCQYGQLQQRESKIWPKALVEFSGVAVAQPGGETWQSHAITQRDYDTVVSEYQHLLNQKYAGGLSQHQEQKLRALKEELNEFGKERYRRISQSQEYREFKQALQVLEEFNKNVSALKNPRRR